MWLRRTIEFLKLKAGPRSCEDCGKSFSCSPATERILVSAITLCIACGFLTLAIGLALRFAISLGTAVSGCIMSGLAGLLLMLLPVSQFLTKDTYSYQCPACYSNKTISTKRKYQEQDQGIELWLKGLAITFAILAPLFFWKSTDYLITIVRIRSARTEGNISYLVQALEDESWIGSLARPDAAVALGTIGDETAVIPLMKAAMQDDVRDEAVVALGSIGDKRAVKLLIRFTRDGNNHAAIALIKIEGCQAFSHIPAECYFYGAGAELAAMMIKVDREIAIEAFKEHLTNWDAAPSIVAIMRDAGWKPKTDQERIHALLAERDRAGLIHDWQKTKSVLTEDVCSGEYSRVVNALYGYIGLAQEDALPDLIDAIQIHGTESMANTYLNCGHHRLRVAAETWAKEHDYGIINSDLGGAVVWGEFPNSGR
jgi:hypothetical protein